ncbi:hypothetical protein B0A48_04809 [Cryoendolithus antarcticus]|uniref:RING-type domain-containing protein n=1 Tax=Cryoendolithus antarcticus TaxID=1507870 RepID=A0A1V8TDS6_9PEZI|nr:hypothetical protein B0A48_04809 [Cryoendolithus antarcticus]
MADGTPTDEGFTLHCNAAGCRRSLTQEAIVTTCSHIFCRPCAERSELYAPEGERRCPTCKGDLNNPDDAAITDLNPSEDYIASVLNGLRPESILQAATRGLLFWVYQSGQEIEYQKYVGQTLHQRHNQIVSQLQTVSDEANATINKLETNLNEIAGKAKKLEDRDKQWKAAYQQLRVSNDKLKADYAKFKQKDLSGNNKLNAEEDVAYALQSGPLPPGARGMSLQSRSSNGSAPNLPVPGTPYRQPLQNITHTVQRPSHMAPGYQTSRMGTMNTMHAAATPRHAPLGNIDPNIPQSRSQGTSSGGMSIGARYGKPPVQQMGHDMTSRRRSGLREEFVVR